MYADNMDDAIRKNIVNTVVQHLVEKKKLLAESESLPSNHYDEAVGMLHLYGITNINRGALIKRVNRSFQAAAAPLAPPSTPFLTYLLPRQDVTSSCASIRKSGGLELRG